MNKYINDAIMIGYILTFLGIVGTVGALETDTIGIGHFVLQILACLGVGWIITRIHNRFGEPFTDDIMGPKPQNPNFFLKKILN